jgi:hypothetical protein
MVGVEPPAMRQITGLCCSAATAMPSTTARSAFFDQPLIRTLATALRKDGSLTGPPVRGAMSRPAALSPVEPDERTYSYRRMDPTCVGRSE